jgi:tetratricopeptide (TPR) repeat protein
VRQAQPHPADNTTALLEAALAYESLGELLMFAQPERVTRLLVATAALQAVNLAEQAGPSPELARAYSTIYMAAGLVPLPWLAELYRCRAVETAHSVNQLPALAWVSFIQGIYQVGIGQWDQAEAALHQSIKICQRLGDRYRGGQAQGILGKVAYYRGQFAQGAALAADLYAKTRQKNDLFAQALGLYQQGENKLRLGQTDEAITFLEAALLIYQENPDRLTYPIIYSLLAVARLRRNEPALALEAADTAARLLAQTAIDVFASFQAYAGVTEVYLGLWEGNDDGGYSPGTNMSSPSQVPILRSKAHQICKAYWKLARVYPIARPQGWLWQGLYEWLDHQPQRAQRVWQNSLAEAEHLAMPYEQGLAHYEIGRHVSRDESVRSMHLSRACEIFARLEAGYDLARAQHALELGDDKV